MTGAALVLHGVKEYTRDIDIGCSKELFKNLIEQGNKIQMLKNFEGIIIDDCIEIFKDWNADKVVYIGDIPVADLYSIRKYKQALAREKDIRDIELIDKYMSAKHETESNLNEGENI